MANNYNAITPEAYVIKTDNKTLAVVPRLLPHPRENEFQKIFDMKESKIRFQIQDRRGGTGKEYSVYFNFSLVDWPSIHDVFQKITTDAQVNPTGMYDYTSEPYVRIYHQVETAGEHQGLCHSIHAIWKRETMKNGTPSRSPWSLTISDGYAKGQNGKNKGSFYEVGGTFKPSMVAMFYFTDKDLKALITYVEWVVETNYKLIAESRITNGSRKYWELKAQGTHDGMRGNSQYMPPQVPATQGMPAVPYNTPTAAQMPYAPVQQLPYTQTQPTTLVPSSAPQMPYAYAQAPYGMSAAASAQGPQQVAPANHTTSIQSAVNGYPTKPYKGIIKSISGNQFILRFLEYNGSEGTVMSLGELPQAVHIAARSGAEKTFYLANDGKVFYFGGMV